MTEEQGLKECESYVQEHKIQQTLKECIVQVKMLTALCCICFGYLYRSFSCVMHKIHLFALVSQLS